MQQEQRAEEPMEVEPAHIMKREKHQQREHYERLAREAAKDQK